jgi:ABC-type bacteriocin/lantibiotic exporter with double-glycine peptidase domain
MVSIKLSGLSMQKVKSSEVSSETRAKWKSAIDEEKKQSERLHKSIQTRRSFRNCLVLIFSICFWFGAIEIFTGSVSRVFNYYARNYDANTSGIIIHSSTFGRRNNSYRIYYEYSVNEMRYKSDDVSFEDYHAKELVKKYPVGKIVVVYYDGQNHKYASLERGSLGFSNWTMIFCALIFSLGISIAFMK